VSSAAGLSLLAQPAAFTCSVSRIVFTSAITDILKHCGGSNWQIAISQDKTSPQINTDVTDCRNWFLNNELIGEIGVHPW
jgi:hypothetical protein